MPSATPAQAIEAINNISSRPSNGREDDRINRNLAAILKDYLAIYRSDDATALTQAWMNSVGGTNANPSVFTIGTGLTISFNTNGTVLILATDPASTQISTTTTTRGGLRRICSSLGITLTEALPPA